MILLNIQLFGGRGAYSKGVTSAKNSNKIIVNSTNNSQAIGTKQLNELMSVAKKNEPQITNDLLEIVSKTNGTINYDVVDGKKSLDYRMKTAESLERKINSDLQEKPLDEVVNGMYDVVRYTDLVNAKDLVGDYESVRNELEKRGYKIKRVKNTFNDESKEYKGLNTVVESPTGYKFELQFHTPESLKIKEINHKLYEKARLDSTSEEEKAKLKKQMLANSKEIPLIFNIDSIKNLDELKRENNKKPVEAKPKSKEIKVGSMDDSIKIAKTSVLCNDRKYYDIDETLARYGHDMYSMSDYKDGSTTNRYKSAVDEVYDLADEALEKCKDDSTKQEYIRKQADSYAKKYAAWINKDSSLNLKYPSQMITGAGGWTQSKIDKKDAAFNNHFKQLDEINKIKENIKRIPYKNVRIEKQGVAMNEDRYKSKYFEVIQNEPENRLQLKFEGKPDTETRELIKRHGFKWSPKNQVWQRQLTSNARLSTRLLNSSLELLEKKKKNN